MHENTHGEEVEKSDTSDRSVALVNFVDSDYEGIGSLYTQFVPRIVYVEGEEECNNNSEDADINEEDYGWCRCK